MNFYKMNFQTLIQFIQQKTYIYYYFIYVFVPTYTKFHMYNVHIKPIHRDRIHFELENVFDKVILSNSMVYNSIDYYNITSTVSPVYSHYYI